MFIYSLWFPRTAAVEESDPVLTAELALLMQKSLLLPRKKTTLRHYLGSVKNACPILLKWPLKN